MRALKKYLAIWILLLFCLPAARAQQSQMSDKQVMSFIVKENEKGTPRNEIVTKLMERGVSIEQIRRLRDKYEREKGKSSLGARDLTGDADGQSRLRKPNGDKRSSAGGDPVLKRRRAAEVKDSELSAAERARRKEDRMLEFSDELDFAFPDSLKYYIDESEEPQGRQVFGRNIFNRELLTFEPNMNIATPADYVLGPGDAVVVDVWGASQKTIQGTVSPEGTVDIEGFGPVQVSGLTVQAANARLRSTLGQRYSGSSVRLSVGQTRTISVNVIGEVNVPGTYTLSAFATVFHALYMAGGINDIGTLRDIKIYRKGRLISSVDIYDFILNGKLSGNVRLASDDVIMVGPYDCLVDVTGKVKRPMYYEMKTTESVGTLLKYAGGFAGDAYRDVIRLIRKSEGELTIYSLDEFERNKFQLTDGDSVYVDSVLARYRNMVEVKGSVFRPGMYQMDGSVTTVRQLIRMAGGLTEDAFTARAVMHRRRKDRTLEVISIDVDGLMNHTVPDVALCNEDVLFIPGVRDGQEERTFSIEGEVYYPGIYEYAENTTLEDLVLQAGGLKDAASVVKVDVSRRIRNNSSLNADDEVASAFSFALKDGFVIDGKQGFVLEPFDEVFVRRSPGYVEQEHVTVDGEIAFAGTYVLTRKGQRLSELVKNAGGVTKEAYLEGARLERKLTAEEKIKKQSMLRMAMGDSIDVKKLDLSDTRNVGINLGMALKNPGSDEWDIVLQKDDRLVIPQFNNTVSISGEVRYLNSVSYRNGAKLDYYINMAGGYSEKARKKHVYAVNMNGTVSRVRSAKDIQPGCEIVIPAKKERRGLSTAEIISMSSVLGTLTIALATLLK